MNLGKFLAGMAECAERDRRELAAAYSNMTDRESVKVRETAEQEANEYAIFRRMLGSSSLLESLEAARKNGTLVEVVVGSENWKELLEQKAKPERRASKKKPSSRMKFLPGE